MFLDLCSPPPLPVSPLPHCIYCKISPTLSAFSFPFFLPFFPSVFVCLYHNHPSFSQTIPPDLWMPYPYTHPLCLSSSDSCLSVCDAVCASGTTASSHLKHFRETHICCFRAQRDMPWQRPFEVASQGEPEPERGI